MDSLGARQEIDDPRSVPRVPQSALPELSIGIPRAVLRELRPKQWLKNGLVFFGLIYALEFTNIPLLLRAIVAFAAFCCIASAGYVYNDLRDVELDRRHPTKRMRPIAAGLISPALAGGLALTLFVAGFLLAATLGWPFVAICLGYVVLTASYSVWLKHVVILDVFAVSAGFVVRAVGGAIAVDVPISPWLYVCTVLGSLVIALAKRRSELATLEDGAEAHRPALEHYTTEFLDQLIVIAATASVMAYSLYTFSAENVPKNHLMMITIPIVLYGVFRYLFLVKVRDLGGSPEELLLSDRSLVLSVILFVVVGAGVLYVSPRVV